MGDKSQSSATAKGLSPRARRTAVLPPTAWDYVQRVPAQAISAKAEIERASDYVMSRGRESAGLGTFIDGRGLDARGAVWWDVRCEVRVYRPHNVTCKWSTKLRGALCLPFDSRAHYARTDSIGTTSARHCATALHAYNAPLERVWIAFYPMGMFTQRVG